MVFEWEEQSDALETGPSSWSTNEDCSVNLRQVQITIPIDGIDSFFFLKTSSPLPLYIGMLMGWTISSSTLLEPSFTRSVPKVSWFTGRWRPLIKASYLVFVMACSTSLSTVMVIKPFSVVVTIHCFESICLKTKFWTLRVPLVWVLYFFFLAPHSLVYCFFLFPLYELWSALWPEQS